MIALRRKRDRVRLTGVLFLAVFLATYGGAIRPYYLHWGATPQEIQDSLPGDPFIPPGSIVTTRALTIEAPVERVWPWLLQMGHGRGGFYSHAWLENLFATRMVNGEEIRPQWQTLKVGDRIAWRQSDSNATWTTVLLLAPPRTLVLEKGYTFHLIPLGSNATRLLVRYTWDQSPLYYHLLLEPAHFVMESGMMLGIKQRAERANDSR